jgi:MFS family permease
MCAPMEDVPETHSAISQPRRWQALVICLVAGFMTVLDMSSFNVALPAIERSLRMSAAEVSWSVAGYALTSGLTLIR